MRQRIKWLISLLVGFMLLCISLILFAWHVNAQLNEPQQIETQLITIKKGESLYTLLDHLAKKKLVNHIWQIKLLSKINPQLTQIKAGTFLLEGDLSSLAVIQHLVNAQEHQFKITFPEGISFNQWETYLQQNKHLKQTDYHQALANLIQPYQNAEGLLFPDTYYFTKNTSDFSIIRAAFQRMQQTRQDLASHLNDEDWYQSLILASIVEKETAVVDEMPLVASVFYNRLDKNMRLQTDPTVIYGLGERYKGDIKRSHLKEKNLYNTYQIKGLPPTPIAMPGLAAIKAVLQPATSDYLYFVADGKGGHVFSINLQQHNQAVRQFLNFQKNNLQKNHVNEAKITP